MQKDHHCYGYIINRAFHSKKLFNEMAWYFIGVYVINRTLHSCLEIQNFFSPVEKYFTRSRILFTTFVSPRSHLTPSIY